MFSSLDANGSPWARRRRGWATLLSFLLECAVIGILVLTPIFFPQVIPRLDASPPLVNLLSFAPEPPPAQQHGGRRPGTSEIVGDTVLQPRWIPNHISLVNDHNVRPDPAVEAICLTCVPGSVGPGGSNLATILGPAPPPNITGPKGPVIVSHMAEGQLLRRVQPVYPEAARKMRIQGPVVLQAIISKEGRIEHLQVVSGHPFLVKAAAEAVQQWRYRPYVLNGEAVEVETLVTVNFVLSES
jgi:periplasmic protein TonB